MKDLEKCYNLENKTDRELALFCYSTLGAYKSLCRILKENEDKLKELRSYKYAEKKEIKRLEDSIKENKIKIETIEFLFKLYFNS